MSGPLTSILEHALEYAAKGFPVFPCHLRGKKPVTKNGFKDATTDREQIFKWWGPNGACPDANLAIPTGEPSNLIVLDADGEQGYKTVLKADLPITPTCRTGSGGVHLFFKRNGHSIRNKVKLPSLPGCDIRGDGGYVIVAPSLHENGQHYKLEIGFDEVSPPDIPPELIEMINAGSERKTPTPTNNSSIPEGQRNDSLFRIACRMRRIGMGNEEIAAAIMVVNDRDCKPPLTVDEVKIITSNASRYEPEPGHGAEPKPQPEPETTTLAKVKLSDFNRTDSGNAKLFASMFGERVRYDHAQGRWIVWDSHWWQPDATATVRRYALRTAETRYQAAFSLSDTKEQNRESMWGLRSQQRRKLDDTLSVAQIFDPISDRGDDWDANPMLLGVANGVIDLSTGALRAGRQEDKITKHCPVAYDHSAECPTWIAFLEKIMGGNKGLIEFLQRAIGISLTGDTSEHVFFILHGQGSNGKSTLINCLLDILGDYGRTAPVDLLLQKRGSEHPTGIAELHGKRLVACIEAEEGRTLAAALIKSLTGGDRVSARFLYKDFMNFNPTHKLWIAVNHRPRCTDNTHSMWRRLKLIPFNVTIKDGEQDKQLPEKLRAEAPGILRWAIDGCLKWRRDGLGEPKEVKEATAAYQKEEDVLGTFLEDCCVVKDSLTAFRKDLVEEYAKWCKANHEEAAGNRQFYENLRRRGFQEDTLHGIRRFCGLEIKS